MSKQIHIMTEKEFKQELKELNVTLMNSETREDQELADTAINNLVDKYTAQSFAKLPKNDDKFLADLSNAFAKLG